MHHPDRPRPTPIRQATLSSLLAAAVLLTGCDGSGPTEPPPQPLVYTALGASDAVGIGAFPLTEGYVFEIADRIDAVRAEEVELRNLGINGARIEQFLAEELEPAVASDPDIVTVWTGSNDVIRGQTPEAFATALDQLLGDLTTRTDAIVFVGDLACLTRAPLFRISPDPDVTRARIDAFNAVIAAAAARHGAVLVRLSAMPIDDSIFSLDGFHPNNAGHERLADRFWLRIEPHL